MGPRLQRCLFYTILLYTVAADMSYFYDSSDIPVSSHSYGDVGSGDGNYILDFKNIKYTIYLDEVTWSDAKLICKAENSILARIPDQATQDAITQFIDDEVSTNTGNFWIDARDKAEDGVWVNSDGDVLTFTAWAPYEPNNAGFVSKNKEACAHMWWEHDYLWNDLTCESDIYFICQSGQTSECHISGDGTDYTGSVSHTESGLECQSWAVQYPHEHTQFQPYPLLGDHNYCRNPGSSGHKAWCYTTDRETRWEYCNVGAPTRNCGNDDIECFEEYDESDYAGHVSTTPSGKTCQNWAIQYPHTHGYRGDVDIGEHNYCRNPSDVANRPWCYTVDPGIRWEYCDVCGTGRFTSHQNIALNKKASQSSLYHEHGIASHAIDGFKFTHYEDFSCTHTNEETDPWWKVDLEYDYIVDEVVITNRKDCCSERLKGAVVRVGSYEILSDNTQCGRTLKKTDKGTIPFVCEKGTLGRYVSVQLEGMTNYLTLCEVEVYGNRAQLYRLDHRCGPKYQTISGKPGECDPHSLYPCCSPWGWCGITSDHCDCLSCIDFREVYGTYDVHPWRDDLLCGPGYSAANGIEPAECDPNSIYPCCSNANWCGISDDHCECYGCVDYREVYEVTNSIVDACTGPPKVLIVPIGGELVLSSPNYPIVYPSYADCQWVVSAEDPTRAIEVTIVDADVAECCDYAEIGNGQAIGDELIATVTKDSMGMVYSGESKLWVHLQTSGTGGRGAGFQLVFTDAGGSPQAWRDDYQCGNLFSAPNGATPAECDPHGMYPCCSPHDWCGISTDHCECSGCIDYRDVYEVSNSIVNACTETEFITMPSDGVMVFTSPNYPESYPSYADCRWVITSRNSNDIIEVSVDDVDILENCVHADIGKGIFIEKEQILSLTADTVGTTVDSESDEIWIHLRSGACQQQGTGFKLTVKLRSNAGTCPQGEVMTIPTGGDIYISSLNYPSEYPPNSNCVWIVDVEPGQGVQITVQDFELEPDFDSVTITSQDQDIALDDSSVNFTAIYKPPVSIEFKSDSSVQYRGFLIKAAAARLSGSPQAWRDDYQCGNLFSAPNGATPAECDPHSMYPCCSPHDWCGISADHCECSGCIDYRDVYEVSDSIVNACTETEFITMPSDGVMVFTSPNYPESYPSYADCKWVITSGNSNDKIEVSVDDVDILENCVHMDIGNGAYIDQEQILSLTADNVGTTVDSESDEIWIHLRSGACQQQGTGFKLTMKLRSSVETCPFADVMTITTGEEISISSSNYPSEYPPNSDCLWVLEVEEGQGVQITVQDIDLEPGFDLVKIKNEEYVKLLDDFALNFTAIYKPPVSIEFKSDSSVQYRGFLIKAAAASLKTTDSRGDDYP